MPRLTGRKLLLTRSTDDAADWADALTSEGAEAIVFPCIQTELVADPTLPIRLAAALRQADWLIFTSRRGVEACAQLVAAELKPTIRFAAVGAATAKSLRAHFGGTDPTGLPVHVGQGTAAVLARELAAEPSIRNGAHCVLALAANAGNDLTQALTDAGATVERFDVYRTVPSPPRNPKHPLSTLGCDTVIFASPSAVAGFDNQVNVDISRQMVTIGPSTTAAVRERRWNVTAEAKEPNLSGIIQSVLEANHV
jgi:uroporphyrinogen-III synthase